MATRGLPIPVAEYIDARNAFDIDAMVDAFDVNAIVKDENQEHRGRDAIRAWVEDTTAKYHAKVEPREVQVETGTVVVSGLVSGDFPGSPIMLDHTFTIKGGKITSLEIG